MLPNTVRYVEINKYFSVFPLFFRNRNSESSRLFDVACKVYDK